VIVNVSDERAATLDAEWEPADKPKRSRKADTDE
jgi:hypothetical protein